MLIRYFAYYRQDAGCKEENFSSFVPVTALELVKQLCEMHPPLKKRMLSQQGEQIHEDVIFLVDGRNIYFLEKEATPIPQDCIVSLFPRIAGG